MCNISQTGAFMTEMLTAKDIQDMLQVDRSTVYRMAESGQLPAIKVGKQWRFPSSQIDNWFQLNISTPLPVATAAAKTQTISNNKPLMLSELLPIECVQLIQDSFADLLGVMLVVTDMEGRPITEPSHPCGLFEAINSQPDAVQKCIQSWHLLAEAIDLSPSFNLSHLGLLCARSMIRVGVELKGMVVAGCIAPETWPPRTAEVEQIAADFGVEPELMFQRLQDVYQLNERQKRQVLTFLPRIANIIAHIIDERKSLVGRLEAIASLTQLKEY